MTSGRSPDRKVGVPNPLIEGGSPDAVRADWAHDASMETTVHEIAQDVYRLSTTVPDAVPGGFTFNQYLIDADEPLLFHCGPRGMFDWSPLPRPESFRWSACAGSASVTTNPTSAGR